MENILDEVCSSDDLKHFEKRFHDESLNGLVSSATQFEYSCFLVRSRYPADIHRGIHLLEDLYKRPDEIGKRDYVFYLALGNARIKNYKDALRYVDGLLKIEPENRQVTSLSEAIRKRMEQEAMRGAAVAGGALLGLGALVGLGFALAKR